MLGTTNLRLSHARHSDAPDLFAILGDGAAMTFMRVDLTLKDWCRRIVVHEYFRRRDGCAPWVTRKVDTNRVVGWGEL